MRGNYPPYSVLLPVYSKDNARDLEQSIASMVGQTVASDDFVVVCDGPLTGSLEAVLEHTKRTCPALKVVRLPKNVGLGRALSIGLTHCQNDLVARMDADDIAVPERAQIQLDCFRDHPELDIVSGAVEEFSTQPHDLGQVRRVPETQAEILTFARTRNPFNHPCVMYRKTSVLAAGGYQPKFRLEDYFLWVRMLQAGAVGMNTPQVLLHMRVGNGLYGRRSGWQYARSQASLLKFMRDTGFINTLGFVKGLVLRVPVSLAPNWARKLAFTFYARHRTGSGLHSSATADESRIS